MKRDKMRITSLIIAIGLALSLFLTACTNDAEEDFEDMGNTSLMATIEFKSDSDNGNEWTFEQKDELFYCEEFYIVDEDEAGKEGLELQSFTLYPKKGGTTTVSFSNTTTDTIYSYECVVSDDLNEITVNSSKGVVGGAEADAPELVIDRN